MTASQDNLTSERYRLFPDHRRLLVEGSANSPDVIVERGVWTVTRGRDLPEGFSWRQRQRGRGMLFTGYRPGGGTFYVYRPDEPDPKNPGHKYEMMPKVYGGPGNVLDIHPSLHHLIADASVTVIFVEGIKKADAITSAARAEGVELVVVAISGVWNWLSEGEPPIPDMYEVPVIGRTVVITFDSDMLTNESVQDACRRLAEHLMGRGAEVWITYFEDTPDA